MKDERYFDVVIDGIYNCLTEKEALARVRAAIKAPLPGDLSITITLIAE